MAYTASKSKTQGRPGFSISFRHPLRNDSKGKPGLKVRRGLDTTDPVEADRLVAQMNQILQDEDWWNADRYSDALREFDQVIVDAFFDDLHASVPDSFEVRESAIALPGREQGYARVLLVGTTGAGKTTLLRHLIGSDPGRDRFPSTSTAKTTVSDTEVIPAEGPYSAVVTFFSETVVRVNVEDCVMNACTAVWNGDSADKVLERFLNHPDQRFRMGYLLGNGQKPKAKEVQNDDWDFGGEPEVTAPEEESISSADAERLYKTMSGYIERVRGIAETAKNAATVAGSAETVDADSDEALEIFQAEVFQAEDYSELVQDVLDDIRSRFEGISCGDLATSRGSSKWPISWTYSSDDRDDFLGQVRWFSSNAANSFGRLLTPLVDGLRVKGPFFPVFTGRKVKVVYLDGQGLGHTPDSSNSVTTHITQRFSDVNVILLVDNAEQPVQAAAQAVLGTTASSGNHSKLAIAFTHFDQVKGLNLPKFEDKRSHVLQSAYNSFSKLKDSITGPVIPLMERALDEQSFMLGALQGPSEKLPNGVKSQLGGLLDFIEKKIPEPDLPDAKPVYDPSGLGFAVQRAADGFQKRWSARLGFTVDSSISKEHWTRIKALNRRLASETDVEYSNLRPVADLVGLIAEEVSNYLDSPLKWSRQPEGDEEAQAAIDPIRSKVFQQMLALAEERIAHEHVMEWRRAFNHSGSGSADRRAVEIRFIYDLAAPIPGTVNSERAIKFMGLIRNIVVTAITESGGEISVH